MNLAYAEAKNIWSRSVQPDIIVSVGTGMRVDKSGDMAARKRDQLGSLKALLPGRVRKSVDMGLDMVASTLDCYREWDDFLNLHKS